MAATKRRPRRTKSTGISPRNLAALVVVVVAVAVALWWLLGWEPADEGSFESRLWALAAERGVGGDRVAADDPIRKTDGVFVRTWRFSFPNRAARDGFIGDVEVESAARGASLILPQDLESDEVELRVNFEMEAFELRLVVRAEPTTPPPTPVPPTPTVAVTPQPAPDARGRLAILLDDGGQNLDQVAAASRLPAEVGFAILPFLPKTAETARTLHDAGHEIWLHLPMEPENYPRARPGPGALLMSMAEAELRAAVHAAINDVPHAIGVNNHMGSRVTADLRAMTWIMQELKARGMAFIDSRTTRRTVAEEAARAQGVPTNRRHVFLDNQRTPKAVRRQLAEAVTRCRMEGEIIAIGHMDEVTISVLTAEVPGLSKRGADLVRPSELVR